jgi:hypothetical protein
MQEILLKRIEEFLELTLEQEVSKQKLNEADQDRISDCVGILFDIHQYRNKSTVSIIASKGE